MADILWRGSPLMRAHAHPPRGAGPPGKEGVEVLCNLQDTADSSAEGGDGNNFLNGCVIWKAPVWLASCI